LRYSRGIPVTGIVRSVQINDSRLDRGVPQILLDVPRIGAAVRLMRGCCVTQPVGGSPARHGGGDRVAGREGIGRVAERIFYDEVHRGRSEALPYRTAADLEAAARPGNPESLAVLTARLRHGL
jgi:hypothetical protein